MTRNERALRRLARAWKCEVEKITHTTVVDGEIKEQKRATKPDRSAVAVWYELGDMLAVSVMTGDHYPNVTVMYGPDLVPSPNLDRMRKWLERETMTGNSDE